MKKDVGEQMWWRRCDIHVRLREQVYDRVYGVVAENFTLRGVLQVTSYALNIVNEVRRPRA
jgi:hypothetical protein